MDNHERVPDRSPDAEAITGGTGGSGDPAPVEPPSTDIEGWPSEPAADAAAVPPEAAEASQGAAPAEIESWPNEPPAQEPWPTEPPRVEPRGADDWPTEPPTAGSGGPDAWPTAPPEPGREPYLPPRPMPHDEPAAAVPTEPMPGEVEAHPAASMPSAADASAQPVDAAGVVPGAAGAVGDGTQCPRCGELNAPGLSFCRNCGQRLLAAGVSTTIERPSAPEGSMACPRCGTHNRTGVAFCQNCGANLRGTAPGYVPPAAPGEVSAVAAESGAGGAVLGPVVLLIGIVGLVTGYLLPFAFGTTSLFERAFGTGGYGIGFWSAYPDAGIAERVYFGLAAAVPVLSILLAILAIAGFVRARAGMIGSAGLWAALLWSVALAAMFVVVELAGSWTGDIVGMLRELSPGGIILFLASLIVAIGALTRFGRG